MQFFCVYIKEAHPDDYVGGHQVEANRVEKIIYDQPKTIEEREHIAEACMLHMNLKMPMLLDNMANDAEEGYVAKPERLYIIDKDGIIAYRGGPGPHGFNMEEWTEAISTLGMDKDPAR